MAAPHRDGGEAHDDLAGVDLSQLDLEHIELQERPGGGPAALRLVALLAAAAVVLWLPSTAWFQLSQHDSGALFGISAAAIVTGLFLGRWLWSWGQRAAGEHAARARTLAPEQGRPSALRRWLVLAAVVAGGAAILRVPASFYYHSGQQYQSTWFVAAAGAIVVGIVLARWLLVQAAAPRHAGEPRRPVVLPPWVERATSIVLGGTALAVLAAKLLGGGTEPGAFEFSFGAVGFVAGVGGAIWLARRFDAWERRHAQELGRRRDPARGATRHGA